MGVFDSSSGFTGYLTSMIRTAMGPIEHFMSGFSGYGWKIWKYAVHPDDPEKGLYKMEIDSLTVRGTMTVFELLIQKIRAVKGALGITQGNGKIEKAWMDESKENWLITIEDEMSFVAHDLIRCQSWKDGDLKGYWVEISEIRKIDGVDTIVIPVTEFSGEIQQEKGVESVNPAINGMASPAEGDEIVQFGNSKNTARQSAIYLHADESGKPAIDILFGINSKTFEGCTKVRLGGGIPGEEGTQNGFWCENGLIKAVAENGEVIYRFSPDGSFNLGRGKILYDPVTNKLTFGSDVTLSWGNLSDDAQQNLKGEKGDPGKNGTSAYYIDLSNENVSIPCTYEGVAVVEIPKSYATVYRGSEVDKTWQMTAVRTGCSGTTAFNEGVLELVVWELSADTATVVVTASKEGCADLTATYTLSKVKAGSPGEDAVVYQVRPAVDVIKKDKNGELTPSIIYCEQTRQTGSSAPVPTSEKKLYYQLPGEEEEPYAISVPVGTAEWIDFILRDTDGTTLDRERVPVVADGTDGKAGSPVYVLDLSNENVSIPCTYEGVAVVEIPKSYATVYRGAEVDKTWQMTAVRTGCSGTSDLNEGVLELVVWELSADTATVVVTASKEGCADLTATYTLSKVKAGSPGEDAVVYQVRPAVDVIKKDKNGELTPSIIYCEQTRQTGSSAPVPTSEKKLYYQLPGEEEEPYAISVPVGTAEWIDFILRDTDGTILDKERVLVVADGKDGDPGNDAVLPEWLDLWDGEKTEIAGRYVISPKIFAGIKNADDTLTGVALGHEIVYELDDNGNTIEENGIPKYRSGLYGYQDGTEIFSLDKKGLFVRGSIAEMFHKITYAEYFYLGSGQSVHLDFDRGFNWEAVGASDGPMFFVLPHEAKYNGVRCNIVNLRWGSGVGENDIVFINSDSTILTNRKLKVPPYTGDLDILSVKLCAYGMATFYAVPDPDRPDSVIWYLVNSPDFFCSSLNTTIGAVTLATGGDLVLEHKPS